MRAIVPSHHSRGIARIGDALAQHAPAGVEITRPKPLDKSHRFIRGEADGDLVILYVNGFHNRYHALAERCLSRGQRYAVIQIALRTTRHPSTNQWRQLWGRASVVWSYYPLQLWIEEDHGAPIDFDFYHAPLGVDPIFHPRNGSHHLYTVCTSGFRRTQEGVAECDEAAFAVGGSVFQLGPEFQMKAHTVFLSDISDETLASMYSACQFVCGLRRHEGFELPAAEGLLCGARPILYDRPHYRDWYGPWGEFIPETDPEVMVGLLTDLFQRGPRPVSESEHDGAAYLFDWGRICTGFWERALK